MQEARGQGVSTATTSEDTSDETKSVRAVVGTYSFVTERNSTQDGAVGGDT